MGGDQHSRYQQLQEEFIRARENGALVVHDRNQIERLRRALAAEERRNAELVSVLGKELRDVEKLSSRSWKRLTVRLREGVNDALVREQLEAQAAADQVDESNGEVEFLRSEIARFETDIESLGDTAAKIEDARAALHAHMHELHPQLASELAEIDEDVSQMRAGLVELVEARTAGENAIRGLDELEASLTKANSLSTVDTWLGGGALVSVMKRDRLKISGAKSRSAAHAMANFDRELSDTEIRGVSLELDMALDQGTFDVWFDNIWTDANVHAAIKGAREKTSAAREQVRTILGVIDGSRDRTADRLKAREAEQLELLSRPQDSL